MQAARRQLVATLGLRARRRDPRGGVVLAQGVAEAVHLVERVAEQQVAIQRRARRDGGAAEPDGGGEATARERSAPLRDQLRRAGVIGRHGRRRGRRLQRAGRALGRGAARRLAVARQGPARGQGRRRRGGLAGRQGRRRRVVGRRRGEGRGWAGG